MPVVPVPENETERLAALRAYGVLDTAPDADFAALVNFIASMCGTPMAAVSLVDERRQWFKAAVGLEPRETVREIAFCAHAIAAPDRPLVVPDALADERFACNPLVTGDPHIRFYAGMPIVSHEGYALGTVCVLDREPRELSGFQLDALVVAARLIMTLIEHGATAAQLALANDQKRLIEQEHRAMAEYLAEVEDQRVRVANELHAESSRRLQIKSALDYSTTYDSLTTLPNRRHFLQRLEEAFATLRDDAGQHSPFAVYVVDIDHCKQINDSLGNTAGDALLVQCAERLLDVVRADDVVARLDSDSFALIAFGASTMRAATSIARKIRAAFETPWVLAHIECVVTASVGVVLVDDRYGCADDILRDANIALDHSKRLGHDRYSVFQESFGTNFQSKIALDRTLSQALANDEFRLVYQPIVSLTQTGRRLEGFEALLRWERPDGIKVPPSTFIPSAEESGLIVPLGAWALKTACLALRQWRTDHQRADHPLQMSVNVSAIQLAGARFSSRVREIMRETGVDPHELVIEVTESAAMQDPERSLRTLRELRELGVGVHVDDFGTGYSSLSYLRRLPVTRVKIDRSFVSADGRDDLVDPVIVGAIISLAQKLDLKVIAEGVETRAQLQALSDLGCDSIQGYYISRPLEGHDAAGFIDTAESP